MFCFNGFYKNLFNDSRKITIGVVYLSLLLDNVLLTMVVPIMPDFLIKNSIDGNKPENNQEYRMISSYQNESYDNVTSSSSYKTIFDVPNMENGRMSILLSSKALVQLILNPVVGVITNRVGYTLPLFLGTCTLLISATVFAFSTGYFALFLARSFQGVASSCIGITGMCLVAEKYPEEPERSKMMGFVLGSVAVGVLIGYPFGGFMYDYSGKTGPFLIIVLFICIDGVKEFFFRQKRYISSGWLQLFSDRKILLTGGAIGISTSTIAILEPCLPIWLLQEIKPKKWQLGTAFIPDSLGYFIGTNSMALIAYQSRRSMIAIPSMILVGLSASLVPAAKTMLQLVIPHFFLGFGIGAVDAALVPLLAALVDTKYSTHYGAVYAMQQISVSLAYSLGPVFGSGMTEIVGFPWMMRIVGIINILYSFLLFKLDKFHSENYLNRKRDIVDYHSSGKINYEKFSESDNTSE
ncbi:synaptic vesicular amine transporter, putative [Pediculus humanus corporis]|uniref:Synaptic vesicular amine transporter, putative n=1 Tax=Pediculus humanus subsp. corporis TaxID=121224 RepID=E0VBQ3_PEDHC|nr:synaptic vesicular amine transporter, putative [Pediculus humanus corporis]EEB10809.1 synaptic vesicular amine transporter, putative [Pediculus humanus corporis]